LQIRQFKPKLVAIRDASKVKQLQELIKDVSPQPEILVGDEGAVEVRSLTRLTRFDQPMARFDLMLTSLLIRFDQTLTRL
jgi:1-deoxy-D-xylulose 5-phosphate reductoisomerase